MAQLTWRDMAAPDLGTSLQGYNQFSNLINSSLGGARNEIDKIDGEQKDALNNRVALAAVQEQDPAKLKAALESGTILGGANPNRLSAQTIALLGQRPGQLFQQAGQELALKDATKVSGQSDLADQRAPLLAQANDLSYKIGQGVKGSTEEFNKFNAANPDLMVGLGYKTAMDFHKGLQNARKTGVDLTAATNELGYAAHRDTFAGHADQRAQGEFGMSQTRFKNEQEDRLVNTAAEGAMGNAIASSDLSNPDSVRAAIYGSGLNARGMYALFQKMPPAYQAALSAGDVGQLAAAAGQGTGASGAGMGAGGNIGGPDTGRVMGWSPASDNAPASVTNKINLIAKKAGAKADVSLSKAQFLNLDMTQLEGKPSAPNNFGNMKNTDGSWQKFNNPAEYQAAQRAWLGRRYDEGARTVTDAVLGYKTGGGSTPALNAGLAMRNAQDRYGKVNADEMLAAAQGPDMNPLDVADGIRASGGRFANISPVFIRENIQDIVKRSMVDGKPTITPAMAGVLFKRHISENTGASNAADNFIPNPLSFAFSTDSRRGTLNKWSSALDMLTGTGSSGNSVRVNKAGDRLNRDGLNSEIERFRKGGLPEEAARAADMSWALTDINKRQSDVYAAQAEAVRLQRLASTTQPALAGAAAIAAEKANMLQRQLDEAKRSHIDQTKFTSENWKGNPENTEPAKEPNNSAEAQRLRKLYGFPAIVK
jgi:hypothetical protein